MLRRLFSSSAPASRILPPTIRELLNAPLLFSENDDTPGKLKTSVSGYIKSIRRQKNVSFAIITDGSEGKGMQAVFSHPVKLESSGPVLELVKQLTNGTSVHLKGTLSPSLGTGQDRELLVDSGKIMGECEVETYPIQKQSLSVEYLRDNAHLRARTDHGAAMIRLRDEIRRETDAFFQSESFVHVHAPISTSNDCEGAGEAFRIAPVLNAAGSSSTTPLPPSASTSPSVETTQSSPNPSAVAESASEFFQAPAYLTVSSQLHLEAIQHALARVYTINPAFRAERSATNRHLAEFWMIEAEWGLTGETLDKNDSGISEVCDVVEGLTKSVLRKTLACESMKVLWASDAGENIEKRADVENAAKEAQWARITYGEAVEELAAAHRHRKGAVTFEFEPRWGKALQSEHEKWLAEKLMGGPVFVTDYPAAIKPFYMRLNPSFATASEPRATVACFDLLIPGLGELAGGSVREERLGHLEKALEERAMSRDEYQWYLDLRRYGGAPHAGFGLGFERMVSWVGGIENVREAIPMPRWAGRMLL